MGVVAAVSSRRKADILNDIGLVGFWECDFTSGEVVVAPDFCRYFGVAPSDGRSPVFTDFLARVHPDDVALAGPERWKTRGPDGISVVKYRVIDETGSIRWVLCRAFVALDDEGRLLSARGLAFDVTASENARGMNAAFDGLPSSSTADRVAELLLEAYRLAAAIQDPSLSAALSVSLHVAGRTLARGMTDGRPQ